MKILVVPCLVTATLSLASFPALAVEPLDTFSVRLGGYIQNFDTQVRADGQTAAGTEIDLDRDLGIDEDTTIGYAGVSWRPWEQHEFGLTYYTTDGDATRALQRDIVFEDTVYEASAIVRSNVQVDTYEAYYTWWAASHETWALGPRVGLIWYRVDMELSMEVDANGNQVGGAISNDASADLPTLTIGGAWRWTPAEDWRVYAEAGYFAAKIGDVDADVTAGKIGVEWFPWENWGVSLDYVSSTVRLDVDTSGYNGDLDFNESGLRLGATYRF
jgi:hypothetical protein